MLWYRETDKWQRQGYPGRPGKLVAKAGTKWHLIHPEASTDALIVSFCDPRPGGLREPRDEVLIEEPTKVKPGMVIPTPGRGATCARCLRHAARIAGAY